MFFFNPRSNEEDQQYEIRLKFEKIGSKYFDRENVNKEWFKFLNRF
jgi:hypothetical protein